jgi:hypothetical protein
MLHGHVVELGTEFQTAKGLLFLGLYPRVSSPLYHLADLHCIFISFIDPFFSIIDLKYLPYFSRLFYCLIMYILI